MISFDTNISLFKDLTVKFNVSLDISVFLGTNKVMLISILSPAAKLSTLIGLIVIFHPFSDNTSIE